MSRNALVKFGTGVAMLVVMARCGAGDGGPGGTAGAGGGAGRGGVGGEARDGGARSISVDAAANAGPRDAGGRVDAGLRAGDAAPRADSRSQTAGRSDARTDGAGASPAEPMVRAEARAPADPCSYPARRTVAVATVADLTRALGAAEPGDRIRLADGDYAQKNFALRRSGTADAPIVVCGSRKAVLTARDGYALHVTGSHLVLSGFHVTGGSKGIMLDGVKRVLLSDLEVSNTQEEGVHFRIHSTDNVIRASYVHDTGLGEPDYGEGIYIGLAGNNWELTGGQPDRSDRNQILGNRIERTAAESIDIKEGTTGGLVADNVFDGSKIAGANSADSFMDVKGNGWIIERNRGTVANNPKFLNGYETHAKPNKGTDPPWGHDNVFRANVAEMTGPGVGFMMHERTRGNVVTCDNQAPGAGGGLVAGVTCAAR